MHGSGCGNQPGNARKDLTIHKASAFDLREYYGGPPPYTMSAYVMREDGKIVAIFGIYQFNGLSVAFSESKVDMKKHMRSVVRGSRILMGQIKISGKAVVAIADTGHETSHKFLSRLGFVYIGASDKGGVYKWQPQYRS